MHNTIAVEIFERKANLICELFRAILRNLEVARLNIIKEVSA